MRTAYTATGSVVVRTEMTANGTADDYDVARKRKIAEAFAAEVDGADADDVRVHVILIVDQAVYDSPRAGRTRPSRKRSF